MPEPIRHQVGLVITLGGLTPEQQAEAIVAAMLLGATELTAGYLCACCAAKTYIRLAGVPYCTPCGLMIISERGRLVERADAAGQPRPVWPPEDRSCTKRGHRKRRRPSAPAGQLSLLDGV